MTKLRPGALGNDELCMLLKPLKVEILENIVSLAVDRRSQHTQPLYIIPGVKHPHYPPKTPVVHIQDLNMIIGAIQNRLGKVGVLYN